MKDIIDFISYASTISEATGYRRRSTLEKYGLIGAKLLFSALQDKSEESIIKEIGQAGLSVLCNMSGRATGDMQRAAQAELVSNGILDIATASIPNNNRRY